MSNISTLDQYLAKREKIAARNERIAQKHANSAFYTELLWDLSALVDIAKGYKPSKSEEKINEAS